MTFRSLTLKSIYDNAADNIYEDLFNPLLSNAISYKRGVGYFTSSWLEMCLEGLLEMEENNGEILLITSPHIGASDWEAFRIGNEAKQNQVLHQTLEKQVEDMKLNMSNSKLTLLAWLIADKRLEIKIAIPKNNRGNFHDKFAIFQDSNGDKIALHGSLNDSEQANYNGEGVSVFCSWVEGQQGFVEGHESRFDKLFLEKEEFYRLYDLPKAIQVDIVKIKENTERPYRLPVRKKMQHFKVPNHIELYNFQKSAIKKWFENNCRGLFEMATGTGKTITSLSAATRFSNKHKNSILLITVPFNHLIDQWEDEARIFGFNPVVNRGNSTTWRSEIMTKIYDVNKGLRNNLCIITTHATGSSDKFLRLMEKTKTPVLYIADECHYLGSREYGKLLNSKFQYRIGLSATPDRWFDDEGSKKLRNYFEKTVIEFTLTDAIEQRFLTPYRFLPLTVSLTDQEYEEFHSLTKRIINAQNNKKLSKSEKKKKVEDLLRQRALIAMNAEDKLVLLKSLLQQKIEKEGTNNIIHTLIYSSPGKSAEVVRMLADLGIRAHEFVHTVSNKKRQELLDQFGNGDIQVLVAIKCLDEGVNVPATKEAYFLASTTNPREFVQRRGRILRKYDQKKEAAIYDFYTLPPLSNMGEDAAAGLIKREAPRFAEFADGAVNEFEARSKILPVLDKFNLRHIIELKPWDIYKEMKN